MGGRRAELIAIVAAGPFLLDYQYSCNRPFAEPPCLQMRLLELII